MISSIQLINYNQAGAQTLTITSLVESISVEKRDSEAQIILTLKANAADSSVRNLLYFASASCRTNSLYETVPSALKVTYQDGTVKKFYILNSEVSSNLTSRFEREITIVLTCLPYAILENVSTSGSSFSYSSSYKILTAKADISATANWLLAACESPVAYSNSYVSINSSGTAITANPSFFVFAAAPGELFALVLSFLNESGATANVSVTVDNQITRQFSIANNTLRAVDCFRFLKTTESSKAFSISVSSNRTITLRNAYLLGAESFFVVTGPAATVSTDIYELGLRYRYEAGTSPFFRLKKNVHFFTEGSTITTHSLDCTEVFI